MIDLKNLTDKHRWTALFGLWVFHGVIELWRHFLLLGGSDSLHSVLNFFIMTPLILWTLLNSVLIVIIQRKRFRWPAWKEVFTRSKTRDTVFISAVICFFVGANAWILHGLFAAYPLSWYGPYLENFLPLIILTTVVSLEIILLVVLTELFNGRDEYEPLRSFLGILVVILAVLGVLAGVVAITGLGIVPSYRGDWSRGLPAVPLLEWQILLAFAFMAGIVFLEARKPVLKIRHPEILICTVIWAGCLSLWLSQPVIPNASALQPHQPNFEMYPFLDAQTYDQLAQSVLIGERFGTDHIPPRPLYIVFLTALHLLAGQSYEGMIFIQILVFALFPVFLYLLGKELFGRPLGISIALLAMLRDHTSNFVSPFTEHLSYSKVFMSEMPAAILMVLFLFLGIRWIRSGFPGWLGFVLGGILGCAMLIRTQVIVALPVIMVFALLHNRVHARPLIKSILLMLTAILLVISPWLWRNWQMTGRVMFDSPEYQMINLALRYSRLNGIEPDVLRQPGESNIAYSQRLRQVAVTEISSDPLKAVWGVANTFLNHGVNNILLFPVRNELKTPRHLWAPTYAFWEEWEGNPSAPQIAVLTFYIFLFGLGIATTWYRIGWLGLLPLGLNLAYNLWTSLALLSGQRFMVTMDWSVYLYYMIGLFALFGGFMAILEGGRSTFLTWLEQNIPMDSVPPMRAGMRQFVLAGLFFWGIGTLLPISERLFLQRYPLLTPESLVAELSASPALNQPGFNAACLQKLAGDNELIFIQGRALYPRHYNAGDGEWVTDSVGYKPINEDRLVFEMVGQTMQRAILPLAEVPRFFPHASDVTLIQNTEGELLFVFVKQNGKDAFYISQNFDKSRCR
jgi:hypothetical protein